MYSCRISDISCYNAPLASLYSWFVAKNWILFIVSNLDCAELFHGVLWWRVRSLERWMGHRPAKVLFTSGELRPCDPWGQEVYDSAKTPNTQLTLFHSEKMGCFSTWSWDQSWCASRQIVVGALSITIF